MSLGPVQGWVRGSFSGLPGYLIQFIVQEAAHAHSENLSLK